MKNICIHFQINQPYRLRNYRFFDMHKSHNYYDDFQNQYLPKRIAERCYLPANQMFADLIRTFPQIAFSFNIPGAALLSFQKYAPDVIAGFKNLLDTGRVEVTGSTFTRSLASLYNKSAFEEQIALQETLLQDIFEVKPVTFCNTGMIYSDEIGEWLHDAGYKIVLTEGARHILGWKNPGYLYCNPFRTDLKLLLRDYRLCDDISLHFQDANWERYPLTAEKFIDFLSGLDAAAPCLNLYLDYETIGEIHAKESGIFDFFYTLISQLAELKEYRFVMPREVVNSQEKMSTMHAPWAISCSGEEKDTAEWLGNEMQQEAFAQLYKLETSYQKSANEQAKTDWLRLQSSEYFSYMGTQPLPKNVLNGYADIYPSPYQAFINYMNILNDVKIELEKNTVERSF